MSEPAEQTIARLTRERDEMATQAAACAEEVDRARVEIGAVQAEVERLRSRLEFETRAARVAQSALAESERKRVEAETALKNWKSGMSELCRAWKTFDEKPRYSPPRRPFGATPTQETSHVES